MVSRRDPGQQDLIAGIYLPALIPAAVLVFLCGESSCPKRISLMSTMVQVLARYQGRAKASIEIHEAVYLWIPGVNTEQSKSSTIQNSPSHTEVTLMHPSTIASELQELMRHREDNEKRVNMNVASKVRPQVRARYYASGYCRRYSGPGCYSNASQQSEQTESSPTPLRFLPPQCPSSRSVYTLVIQPPHEDNPLNSAPARIRSRTPMDGQSL